MMHAMFSDDFIESSARVVKFPGVTWWVLLFEDFGFNQIFNLI